MRRDIVALVEVANTIFMRKVSRTATSSETLIAHQWAVSRLTLVHTFSSRSRHNAKQIGHQHIHKNNNKDKDNRDADGLHNTEMTINVRHFVRHDDIYFIPLILEKCNIISALNMDCHYLGKQTGNCC